MSRALWVKSARWADTMCYQTPVMRRCFWGALRQGTKRMKGIYHRPADVLFCYFLFRWARGQKSKNFTVKLDFQFLVETLSSLRITSCMIIGWTWAEAVSSQQGTWASGFPQAPALPPARPGPHHSWWPTLRGPTLRKRALPLSHHDQAKETPGVGPISHMPSENPIEWGRSKDPREWDSVWQLYRVTVLVGVVGGQRNLWNIELHGRDTEF